MQTNDAIQQHANYAADDYAYLSTKGWTAAAIAARWDAVAKRGKGPCRWQTDNSLLYTSRCV